MSRLVNATTGEVVLDELELAASWWARFRGLMLRRPLPPGRGLLIEPCTSIHMMWMLFPIDAIWLDETGRVTKVSRGVPPWVGAALGGKGARRVVELRASGAANVQPGHELRVEH